jgi:putative sigma-54 modulation protein
MKIIANGKGITINKSFHDRVEEKLGKFHRYFGDDATASVKVKPDKNRVKLEVTLHVQNRFYRGETVADDPYTALDAAVDVLEGQIRKHKSRIEKRIRDHAFMKEYLKDQIISESESTAKIIKTKKFELIPMDPEDATLQMEMLGHSFLLFLNPSDGKVNLVYKRKDGNYGLIEPEY